MQFGSLLPQEEQVQLLVPLLKKNTSLDEQTAEGAGTEGVGLAVNEKVHGHDGMRK